jgi:hypothetical protein
MTWWTPVLYFGENSSVNSNESSGSDGTSLPQDWQFCVVYEGLDTYNVHGQRNSTNQTWDMTFLSRQSLAQFLLSTLSPFSVVTTTLYVVDEDSLWRDNFYNYYQSWHQSNELYSHQSLWVDADYRRVMDHLLLLRDTRVN